MKTSTIFIFLAIAFMLGGGAAYTTLQRCPECFDRPAGEEQTRIRWVEREKEISVLKEQKDCERASGTFYISDPYPYQTSAVEIDVDNLSGSRDVSGHREISCSAPDLFRYELK